MGMIGKRRGKVVKGAGQPGSSGSVNVGGSLSKNDHWYLQEGFGFSGSPGAGGGPQGHEATGGTISDYTDPTGTWRAHVFAQSGTFTISSLSDTNPATVEYLVVAGGGGGGGSIGPSSPENAGGGGGGGGLKTNYPGVPDSSGNPISAPSYTVTASDYTVVVGGGGGGGGRHYDTPQPAVQSISTAGNASAFYPAPVSSPHPTYIGTVGGGRGGDAPMPAPAYSGGPGGSGGGGANSGGNGPAGSGTSGEGYNGGACGPGSGYNNAGGGGGAGYNGQTGGSPGGATGPGGHGGAGVEVRIAGPTAEGVGGDGPNGSGGVNPVRGGYFAGGGGGSTHDGPPTTFGAGGSWSNPNTLIAGGPFSGAGQGWPGDTNQSTDAQTVPLQGRATSGGGGGGASSGTGGQGGSGVVVVRYKIGSSQTGTAKATGGAISFTPAPSGLGLTIHTFFNSGTFTVTDGPLSCKVVCIGGGGGGGSWVAGGGGSGGLAYTTPTQNQPFADGNAYTVQVGGGGQGGWVDPGGQENVPANPQSPGDKVGQNGGDSKITHPTLSPHIIGKGGGGGGAYDSSGGPSPINIGRSGGCGGGGSGTHPATGGPGGSALQPGNSSPPVITMIGYAGGDGGPSPNYNAGGGGGTQSVGGDFDDTGPTSEIGGGNGGTGTGAPQIPFYPYIGIKTPDNTFGGGGGGGCYNNQSQTAVPNHGKGKGGGGNGVLGNSSGAAGIGGHALAGTGSGGGGSTYVGSDPQNEPGGNGGSGFVVIAYPT